jgi:ABC-type antimicrobial peptide transport system permease subunit
MALGAQRTQVLYEMMRQGVMIVLIGVAIGLVGAFGLTRYLESQLTEVTPTDPVTFVAVPLLLAVIALLACLIPAMRAARLDPYAALRYE